MARRTPINKRAKGSPDPIISTGGQRLGDGDRARSAELPPLPRPNNDAAAETARVGKQVSAILIAAHESADETRRLAEAEADRRIADAERRARSITEAPHRALMRLYDEMASLTRERDRLLDEIGSVADRLRALANKPSEELPTESLHDSSGG